MEELNTPRAQWLRGVLDMCLPALMAERPVYGYEMS
ncbi:PadR family transcriptional regulator, partial [Streptomyces solincola]